MFKRIRDHEISFYPTRAAPASLSDPVDLVQLTAIRTATEPANTACPYGVVGNDDSVNAWIEFGETQGLLTDEWKNRLNELTVMGRADANRILMADLA